MLFENIVILFLSLIKISESAKILAIYPTPAVSHQVVFQRITKDLLDRGHNLTVLTPSPLNKNHPNLTEIDLSSSYDIYDKRYESNILEEFRESMFDLVRSALNLSARVMNEQLKNPGVKKLINEKQNYNFDIMIMECTVFFPYLAFAEIFDVPVIGVTSSESINYIHQITGSDANMITNPEFKFPYLASEITFIQRCEIIKARIISTISMLAPPFPFLTYGQILKEHFPEVNKNVLELMDRVEMMMINAHPALGFVRPIVPNTIQLGFLHIEPPKPLEDGLLKKFLDESKNGVIYVSFGSSFRSKLFSRKIINIFIDTFKELEQNIVWKYENEELPNKPDNVMIRKWAPQADLLAHPNVKIFITQSGQQSSEEAVDRTVPMIAIPLMADQPGLAIKLQDRGVSRYLDFKQLSKKLLKEAIDEMLKPEYKANAIKLRELVYDQPMPSREKAIWWIEYFIRHNGTNHQAYPGRLVPFYKKYCLDFIAIAVILWHILIKFVKFAFTEFRKSLKTKIE